MKSQALRELGRRVAAYRRRAGLTQEQLAERLRVTPETVSRFERGVIAPSFERLEMLAAEFRIGLRDLFDFDTRLPSRPAKTPEEQATAALVRELRGHSSEGIRRVRQIVRDVSRYGKWRASLRRGKAV
jgi:transcriptional regulator with XRE-family HTH domain